MLDVVQGGFELKDADEDYCTSEPVCTPLDDGWQVCDTGKKGEVKSINVCVDNVDLCVGPFDVIDGLSIHCGECQVRRCAAWCANNEQPLSTKCNWVNCNGCDGC